MEKSHFNTIDSACRGYVCTNCMDHVIDMIASPLNSKDVFCSEICLQEAMEFFHQRESLLIDVLNKLDLTKTEWNAAFRAILRKPLSYFLENRKELFTKFDVTFGTNLEKGDIYSSDDYKALANLVTSEGTWYIQRLHYKAFVTWFFVQCLRKLNYFEAKQSTELSRDEIFIASLLIHLMNVASTNAIEIASYAVKSDPLTKMEGTITPNGVSINPVIALLNHSCDPNITRVQNGRCTMAIANRTIQENEEISNIYFVGYWEKDIQTRAAYFMDRYQFKCQCMACTKKWPISEDLPKNFNDLMPGQLINEDSDPRILMQQVSKIQKVGSSISLEQKKGNYKKAYSYCIEFIRLLEETLHRPHYYYLMAEKSLSKLANILYGTVIVQDD